VHLAWAAVLLVVVVVCCAGPGPERSPSQGCSPSGARRTGRPRARSISDVGYFWQGRYTLPLAVGVPLVAAAGSRARLGRRSLALLLAVLAVCHLVGYVITLGRYTVGPATGWD
jgi:hypothetical protein